MAIYRPGERHRYHRILSKRKAKRGVTAILSLTAMVDMFTVLVIFLLQNYNTTGEILYIPKEVVLPQASAVKELKPAHVVTVSSKEILLDQNAVATYDSVNQTEEWSIEPLRAKLQEALAKAKEEHENKIATRLRGTVEAARGEQPEDLAQWNKVTIQADKDVDFLTVKKVLYTVTEAGAGEINFAVNKRQQDSTSN